MHVTHHSFQTKTHGQGLYEVTADVQALIPETANGIATIFIQHTSASLTIQENADPSAKNDLEVWMKKHVPPGNPDFTHIYEGPDDMPSHIKSALTQTSLSIPVVDGDLALGTWQGIYLWEHRDRSHNRNILVTYIGNE